MVRRKLIALALSTVCAAAVGCAVQPDDASEGTQYASADDEIKSSPYAMPADVCAFEAKMGWGQHHLMWHTVRQWDLLEGPDKDYATQQGWRRAALQEGDKGNGLEFLAMHRVMIRTLRTNFPKEASLFVGWSSPPTNPKDKVDPIPHGGNAAFDANMLAAIENVEKHPEQFADDDAFGLYLETTLRPIKGSPDARSKDGSTGIHNYMHNRLMDPKSAIDLGDPSVNLQNKTFWRLHGWIDAMWTAYRKAKGSSENDPKYKAALAAADLEMNHMPAKGMPGMPGMEPPPMSLRKFFEGR